MKITVLIPSDSTLSVLRTLQKRCISEVFKSVHIVFFPNFPLWAKLSDIEYNPELLQQSIVSCKIGKPKAEWGKIVCPLTIYLTSEKRESVEKKYEIVLAVMNKDSDKEGRSQKELWKKITKTVREESKENTKEPASRVFKIGCADFKDISWELTEFKWIKTAPKKVKSGC